jgi:tRNA pseudouridine38-40 synthase
VANFRTTSRIPAAQLPHAINANVADDIAVLRADDVGADFHARYSAKRKTYRYRIVCRPVRPAVGAAFAHWHRQPLDAAAMQRAAALLLGEHDFAAFESHSEGEGTVRTIFRSEWLHEGERLDYGVTANGFLYNMVRAMVGTMLEIGSGKRPPEDVARLLESRDRALAGRTAPAKGLCLISVEYD